MIKKVMTSLMAFMLAITMFSSCNAEDFIEDILYGFDIGDYDYEHLYVWLGNITNASNFDFDTTLPPQGSVSSRSYNSGDNTFRDFSVDSSTGDIQITNLNFQTENIIPDTYPSIIYASTVAAFIKKTIDGEITWDTSTLRQGVTVSGYHIMIYSTNDNWRTLTAHKTSYISPGTSSAYDSGSDSFDNIDVAASQFFVAVAAVPDGTSPDPYIAREVVEEVHKDQGLLTDASRRDEYFTDKGISDVAIRFYEIVDNNSFDWSEYIN